MVTFNLYPWRPLLRDYQRRAVKKILASTFLSAAVISLVLYGALLHREEHARLQLAAIKRELKRYTVMQTRIDKKISDVMSVDAAKQLFAQQEATKELFAGLGSAYDTDVCFNTVARSKNKIKFNGDAHSALDLRDFFRSWRTAQLFSDIYIEELEQQKDQRVRFRFQASEHVV